MIKTNPDGFDDDAASDDSLKRQVEILERENARMKKQLNALGVQSDDPNFDIQAFQKAMAGYSRLLIIPAVLIAPLMILMQHGHVTIPDYKIGSWPLIAPVGPSGITLGIIAFGGVSLGVVAIGGFAVGGIAIGGGAIGLIAFGGGAIGVLAFGGGAIGVYAIGGGALGYYVLGGGGAGRYVFTMKRQDHKAVEFWIRWFPRFKEAVVAPLPVIPVSEPQDDFNNPLSTS